jgi:hypothetical protein
MATKKQAPAKKKAAPKPKAKAPAKKAAARKVTSKTTTVVKKAPAKIVDDAVRAVSNVATQAEVKEVANALQKTTLGKRVINWFKSLSA